MNLAVALPPEAVELIAQRVADIMEERQAQPQGGADEWLRGAKAIADYLGCPVSRVNALSSAGRIPLEKDGRSLTQRKSVLDEWIRSGGGKRP